MQSWRPDGAPTAAVAKGAKVIMSMANRAYLDMKYDANTPIGQNWAGFIDVRTGYDWDPATVVPGIPEAAILGVEAPIWTETLANMRDVEFMAFPRLPGVAEVAWSPAGPRLGTISPAPGGAGAPLDGTRRQLLPLAGNRLAAVATDRRPNAFELQRRSFELLELDTELPNVLDPT